MDNQTKAKIFENVYSLKKQRTMSYKIDQQIKQNAVVKIVDAKSLNPSKSCNLEEFNPLDSLISLSLGKRNVSNMYKSKILPSQFLITPVKILKKLTRKVYTYRKAKDIPIEFSASKFSQSKPDLFLRSFNKTKANQKLDKTNKHFDSTCQEILDDNKHSKKIMKIATQYLTKRAKLTTKLIDSLDKYDEKANFVDFQQKLRDAHIKLVEQNKIYPKRLSKSNRFTIPSN